jgi:hypothetical protein
VSLLKCIINTNQSLSLISRSMENILLRALPNEPSCRNLKPQMILVDISNSAGSEELRNYVDSKLLVYNHC